MTISFIELDFHHDVVDGFCRTFAFSDVQITFFIKKTVYEKLQKYNYIKSSNFKWILFEHGTRVGFLNKQINAINNADCVFINTLSSEPFAYINVAFRPKVILRVHNVNKLFNPFNNIKIPFTPFFLWKAFSYTIRELLVGKYLFAYKKLQQLPDYFAFPDNGILEYALDKSYVHQSQVAPCFSFKVNENIQNNAETVVSNVFKITIIGGIDKRRRDYDTIVDTFTKLVPTIKNNLQLILLGSSNTNYGKKIVSQLKQLETDLFKVISYESIVPQDEFDEVISTTSMLLCPIQVDSIVEIYHEIYGQTKISGSIHDSIRFPKFSIIPQNYKLDSEKARYFDSYIDSDDLVNKLNLYIQNPALVQTRAKAYHEYVIRKFSVLSVRTEFTDFINKIK